MKMLVRLSFMLLLASACLTHTRSSASDKKQPDKKPAKAKDIVVDGEITNVDAKDTVKTDCYCKTYIYKMVKGRSYQIDMEGQAAGFDAYLRLEDKDNKQVAEDDDSGGATGLDARIIYKADTSGDFTVICTTFGANATGKFKLTIKDVTDVKADPKNDAPPPLPKRQGAVDRDRTKAPVFVRAISARE